METGGGGLLPAIYVHSIFAQAPVFLREICYFYRLVSFMYILHDNLLPF